MATLQDISAQISQRDLAGAASDLRKFVKRNTQRPADWPTAMQLSLSLGDQETTLAAARASLAQVPQDPRRLVDVIEALGAVAKFDEAAQLSRKLRNNPAAAADAWFLEGIFLARKAMRDEALNCFRRALKENPKQTAAWEQIALLGGYEDISADLATMTALADRPLTPALAVPLCYALARTYDHLDDIESAYKWYAQGAALRDKATPFDIAPYVAYLARLRATFTPELIRRFQNESGGENLLFVLSSPRSGTTLLEQILATSPKVKPTGEHMVFRNASLSLGNMEPVDMARADSFANKDWRQMAQAYQSGLRKRFGAGAVYTDKSLLNSNYAGLMRILFPQAKFVVCVRDKRDTAWSCFRSHINANRWAQRHDTCAQFLHAQGQMQHHWAQIFGEDLVTIRYEDLIQDPEHTTQTLFHHAGVDRPDDWSDFYQSGNPVATASLSQVRRPLNDASIGAWRRYEQYLAPAYDRYFP